MHARHLWISALALGAVALAPFAAHAAHAAPHSARPTPLKGLFEELPAGEYTFRGHEMIDGEAGGETTGIAWLTHTIPAGPALQSPAPRRRQPQQHRSSCR